MWENRKKLMILSLFSAGIIGTATYLMSTTFIEGAIPDKTVTSSSEPTPKGKVTVTSDTLSSSTNSEEPVSSESVAVADAETETSTEIPASEAPTILGEVYTVQSGETLWEIAQETGISMQKLMNDNQLSSGLIIAGQELVIAK